MCLNSLAMPLQPRKRHKTGILEQKTQYISENQQDYTEKLPLRAINSVLWNLLAKFLLF